MSRKLMAVMLAAVMLTGIPMAQIQASSGTSQATGSGGADVGQATGFGRADVSQAADAAGAGDAWSDAEGGTKKDPYTGNTGSDSTADNIGSNSADTDSRDNLPEENQTAATLAIDNQNIYDGMDCPYSEGYAPKIANGQALVVVPLCLEGEAALRNNSLRVSLDLGDTSNSPFSYRNYDKNISLQNYTVNNGTATVEAFVASFGLELVPERMNGSYPVTLTVEGTDMEGNNISQNFVIYVTITDGKDPNAVLEEPEPEPEDPPTFAPKLLVQSYRYSQDEIQAGDEMTVEITMQNTSTSQQIKNLTVTISEPGEYLSLQSPSDSIYIDSVKAGETCAVAFVYRVHAATPEGQYELTLAMDYADAKGNTYTGSGKAKLSVKQPLKLQFDPVVLPEQMEVGDVTQLQLAAMNLGRCKVYHVRAELAADGLTPQGTIYIGDIEAGTMASGSTQITVGGLKEGSSMYGETQGTVTFYYEDEAGMEQSQQLEFTTTIASPFTSQPREAEEDEPGQWWIIMATVLVLLCCCAAIIVIRAIQKRKYREDRQ